ncbi:winged helix-turn-helix transcriptional regulator [Nocardioides panaciterrulae]|uniref:DNA-binding HxlR family transcriptional regulator/peroxiredoxin n=1 Tax=Nocardioides panaciterrulae TaxID=661492 RepID=A0A7Y9E8A1_9ACTN|nr:winged helix-turn-helix transcriptional regulator [Nocardioides panaciterrulae]NYD43020.1 DNA-binding HxlR family transcriptional regulator/peroxiredoxin [Nocardioides panaciterrulae]
MTRRTPEDDCGVAHAVGVLGDAWSVLVLRDVARGHRRFEQLLESGISRKVLAQRLAGLVEADVLRRVRYRERPERFEYVLTARGRAALPVLAALQEWGDTWLLGDGSTSATASAETAEAHRVAALVGRTVPALDPDPLGPAGAAYAVLYCYPGSALAGLDDVPGGAGCTLESCTYRDRLDDFAALGARVLGVSTQRPEEQAEFARRNRIQFPLVSDLDLGLATALRLPTFRLHGTPRLKRITLVVDRDRVVRGTLFPIRDVTGSVEDALTLVRAAVAADSPAPRRSGQGKVHHVQPDVPVRG